MVMSLVWQVFEPLLFGLVGAEVSVEYMNTKVVGEFICFDAFSLLWIIYSAEQIQKFSKKKTTTTTLKDFFLGSDARHNPIVFSSQGPVTIFLSLETLKMVFH